MDAKDLRIESAPSDHNNDGSKYAQSSVLQCNRNKSYQDIGSNSLAKVDVPTARPCAVIGPDRVIPPAVINDAYIKKSSVEPWPCLDHTYRRPPEYPQRNSNYQNPTRNISPRQTFQENMPRIMVPPTFSSVKANDDPHFAHFPDRNVSLSKNTKINLPSEAKYCDVPYNVNPLTNDQKNTRNAEISASSVNPVIPRTAPHGWPPGSVNLRPSRVYGAPELYQYPEYPSCGGPRSIPISRPHRTVQEDPPSYVYSEPYYHEANIRFKPYPTPKDIQRYPQPRYEYIGNYSNPFHPPPPFPPYKYELQKPIHPHPYQAYPHFKYLEGRISDPVMEGYQRSPNQQANYNIGYRNQIIHPPYGPALGNAPQNKMHPYPTDGSIKSIASNKLPYENNNKMYLEHENARNKTYPSVPENFYLNDMSRVHPIRNQVIMANYPSVNMHPMHPYYKKENSPLKNYEYMSQLKSMDPSMTLNNSLLRHPSRFSPGSIAISPSDSNTSIDNLQTQGNLQEDCGYVSQSSTASVRSIETGINRIPNDYYKKYDYRYGPVLRHPSMSKPEINHNSNPVSKTNKNIDVRQFLQMWNEGEDENNENTKETVHANSNDKNNALKHDVNNQGQLYVLGLVNVPREELGKYEHIQTVSKLPENIKGYSSIELLNQFEEAIESSNINCHKPPTPREFSMLGKGIITKPTTDIMHRPLSPLDVESKISQSVIHKEVGCNFEIKPCSPKMLNVEIAAPIQNILNERLIEKVANPLMMRSPIHNGENNMDSYNALKRQDHRLNLNDKVPSCKMINTQFSTDHSMNSMKTNYSLHDLESNSGVCLASLPRLDNDIELSFPEVNQQFINANKAESTISVNDLPALETTLESEKTISKDNSVLRTCNRVEQFSPILEAEKEFVKLSKYRKTKVNSTDYKEVDIQLTTKAIRTDSVIIKNPDNIKSSEIPIGTTTKNDVPIEIQQTAINLSSHCNVMDREEVKLKLELTTTENSKDIANDVAIDFSLNKQADTFFNTYVEYKNNSESLDQKYQTESKSENFENKSGKTQCINVDDELVKSNNMLDNIIKNCDKDEKYLGENIEIVDFIKNSEKCLMDTSAPIIKTADNEETDDDNISIINALRILPLKPTVNADGLLQNNNDLECTSNSTANESDVIQNKLSEVLSESEIDQEIKPNKDGSSCSENQDLIGKTLFDIQSDGLFKNNYDHKFTTNSRQLSTVENDKIQNNLSEVIAESLINESITSNKDTSRSEHQDAIENTLFVVKSDMLRKNNDDQQLTTNSKQYSIVENDKIQNNLSEVIAESLIDQSVTSNKDTSHSEHQDPIEDTMLEVKSDRLSKNNDDQQLTTNSKQLSIVENDKIQNNLSEVIAESLIDLSVTSNKDTSHSEHQDAIENTIFDIKSDRLSKNNDDLQFNTNSTQLSIVENDKILNNLSEVLAESLIDQSFTLNKDSSHSEHQDAIENTLFYVKSDGLFKNNDDLQFTTNSTQLSIVGNDKTQNNSEVLTESVIDQPVTSNKETSHSEHQDVIEKTLIDIKSDGLFQNNDDRQCITNATQFSIAEGKIKNNLSEVLAESKIDQTVTLIKENTSHYEHQEVLENTSFHKKTGGIFKNKDVQECTTNSIKLLIVESEKDQDMLSEVLTETEIDQTIISNEKGSPHQKQDVMGDGLFNSSNDQELSNSTMAENVDITNKLSEIIPNNVIDQEITSDREEFQVDQTIVTNKEVSSLFENQELVVNSNLCSNISVADVSDVEGTKTATASTSETEENNYDSLFGDESHHICSDMQNSSLEVDAGSNNDIPNKSKSQIISTVVDPNTILSDEKVKSASKSLDTLFVSNQYLLWNEQSNCTQNIEDTDVKMQTDDDFTCKDRYEEEKKNALCSGSYKSIAKLLLGGNDDDDKPIVTSEVYAKCSKALYSPWIQKLLLYNEGNCCEKLNNASKFEIDDILGKQQSTYFYSELEALNNAHDSSAIETKHNKIHQIGEINADPILNIDNVINNGKMCDITDAVLDDLNGMSSKVIQPDGSDLSQSGSIGTHEFDSKIEIKVINSENECSSSNLNYDDSSHLKLDTNNTSIGNDSQNILNDKISILDEFEINDRTHIVEDNAIKDITVVHYDKTDILDENILLESKKETREFIFKSRLPLKRSSSDSAINVYKNEFSQDSDNNTLSWPFKRKKICKVDGRVEADLIAENVCKILQNNRRNSISSSIYNEENVSICIFIDNNCIITEENDGEAKVCYTELPDDCLPERDSDSVIDEQNTDLSTEDISCFEEKSFEFIPFNQCPILDCGESEKGLEESWVDDVACVETVVSDDIAEDIEISAPSTPKDTDSSDNDESGFFCNSNSDHTDKVKYIYGDKMCNDDAQLVEKLYRTPQMNVNKTLINKEFANYYDKESLEKLLSDSNSRQGSPCTSIHTDSLFLFDNPIKTPDDKENVDTRNLSPSPNKNNNDIENDMESDMKDMNEYSKVVHDKILDVTVDSCESSLDNVFNYQQTDETNSLTSCSPEVSSTTSEEKNSGIMLKITNYNGSIISQINDIKSENNEKFNSKFTEQNVFINSCPNIPTNRPLITKAAQKYIPPLKESIRDLKVKLSLPQHSLIKLKQMKISKDKPKLNKHITVPKTSMKPKPKFEDVLKSIDEIQFKMHKEKSKKLKKTIPKVVIKKTQNGSHYASTSNKDVYNPDLTGRKWQPWVFLEKNTFIDKMAIKKHNKAIFSHRRNTYVLAEKFRKYKSVSSTKFVISQPKLDASSSGHLKYTIKLKHTY